MNKIKIIIIILIAILGAYLIYDHFDKIKPNEEEINKFQTEYEMVEKDNIYEYKSIDEIIKILSNETGVVFFCTKESSWCQYYAVYLNDVLKENNIDKINYLDISSYRELNTAKYNAIVDKLSNYLYTDDSNTKNIFMPDVVFVKDGNIVAHDNETSLVLSDLDAETYWTQENINRFKNKIKNYVILLSEENNIE